MVTEIKQFFLGTWFGSFILGLIVGIIIGTTIVKVTAFNYDKIIKVNIGKYRVTTYHAVPAETDASPDFGAGGRVAINGVPTGYWFANNQMDFGTQIIIPDISPTIVWTCRDRLNSRYNNVAIIDLLVKKNSKIGGLKRATVYMLKHEKLR